MKCLLMKHIVDKKKGGTIFLPNKKFHHNVQMARHAIA